MPQTTVGSRLYAWRNVACLTQYEAAQVFGCTETAYRLWESDQSEPTGRDFTFKHRVENLLRRFERSQS